VKLYSFPILSALRLARNSGLLHWLVIFSRFARFSREIHNKTNKKMKNLNVQTKRKTKENLKTKNKK
jgi:hypothetical protein